VNLESDLKKRYEEYPEKLRELSKLSEMIRMDIGDNDLQRKNQRPAGWMDNPQYMILEK